MTSTPGPDGDAVRALLFPVPPVAFQIIPSYLGIVNLRNSTDLNEATIWYPAHLDQYLNRWFAGYDAARESLEREGGYLLPYKHHFFVCDWGAIKAMGLDPQDPDWKAVGFDCARPADPVAFRRLLERRTRAARKEQEGEN